jgi:transcriptional regulator with XRE-family HTH domain
MKVRTARGRTGLTARTGQALAENLNTLLEVAGSDARQAGPLPVARLHAETGISKSTLFKLSRDRSARDLGNPDLETLCRLADALKVPPALLLMSKDDWRALIGALAGLGIAVRSPLLGELTHKTLPSEMAEVGLKLAQSLTLYPEPVPKLADSDSPAYHVLEREMVGRNERKRQAILSTTALLQDQARNEETLKICTAIGAMMGAAHKPN